MNFSGKISGKSLLSEIIKSITLDEPIYEKKSIAISLIEYFFQLELTHILIDSPVSINEKLSDKLVQCINRLNSGEPLQYILGKSHFLDFELEVNPNVLIPRPETEELVQLIFQKFQGKNINILDIGTGSGCIAISLDLLLPLSTVFAVDIDHNALSLAKQNASRLYSAVQFNRIDIINESLSVYFETKYFDIIVSNPPYVLKEEIPDIKANVKDHEPALALFVENEDPLIFFERISAEAVHFLKPGGSIFFEINERFGEQVKNLLKNKGFSQLEILRDLNSKDRFVYGKLL